jgi:hypothetical protein
MLEGVWDNLTSGGISKRVPSGAARSRRRTGGRRLHRCEDCSALVIVEPISARTADHAVVVAAIDVIIAAVAVEPVKVTMEMWPLPSLPWKISPPCPPRYTSQHPGDRLSQDRAARFRGHHLPNCWIQQERHGVPTAGSTVLGMTQLEGVSQTVYYPNQVFIGVSGSTKGLNSRAHS